MTSAAILETFRVTQSLLTKISGSQDYGYQRNVKEKFVSKEILLHIMLFLLFFCLFCSFNDRTLFF